MEDIISVVVFLVFIGVAGLAKWAENKRLARQRKELSEQEIRPEDMPEETRRMLYGAPSPPTARPRGTSTGIPTAAPRRAGPQQGPVAQEGQQPYAPPRPQERPARQQQVSERRQPQYPRQQQQQAPQQQRRPQQQFPRQQYPRQQQAQQPPAARPPHRAPVLTQYEEQGVADQARAEAEQLARQAQQRAQQAAQQRAPRRRLPGAHIGVRPELRPRRKRRSAPALFNDLSDFRRGIIMQEILGPPKSIRESGEQI